MNFKNARMESVKSLSLGLFFASWLVACATTPEAPPVAAAPAGNSAANNPATNATSVAATSVAPTVPATVKSEPVAVAVVAPDTATKPIGKPSHVATAPVMTFPAENGTESANAMAAGAPVLVSAAAEPAHETKLEKKEEAPQAEAAPAAEIKNTAATGAAEKHASHREVGKVPWDKALGWLKNGNTRYRKGFLRKDGQGVADREHLEAGQHPHAIVLSCSDSRVPPEIVFDQKLGELFVVRTAGEALDSSVLASIEYAVSHLGPNLLVVMGHESCGAVKAAFGTMSGGDAGSAWLNKLVADIHPRIMSFKGKTMSKGGLEEGWANVQGVAKDLIERSDIIREAVESGTLKITKSVYHLGSGEVEWKD